MSMYMLSESSSSQRQLPQRRQFQSSWRSSASSISHLRGLDYLSTSFCLSSSSQISLPPLVVEQEENYNDNDKNNTIAVEEEEDATVPLSLSWDATPDDLSRHWLYLDKLTSRVFGNSDKDGCRCRAPQDWLDVTVLLPHEALRRETAALCRSVRYAAGYGTTTTTTTTTTTSSSNPKGNGEAWQQLADWYVQYYYNVVQGYLEYHHHHYHHDEQGQDEETRKAPLDSTRALPGQAVHGHDELVTLLRTIRDTFRTIMSNDSIDHSVVPSLKVMQTLQTNVLELHYVLNGT